MSLLEPDRYFARLSRVDIDRDLLACGITHALLDVDNTVRSRADNEIPRDVRGWIEAARAKGVRLCLFSNSWHTSTLRYGEELDIPVVMRSVKPLPIGTLRALGVVDGKRRDTVVIGDQVLTDMLAARLLGMPAYLIVPLSEINIKSARWQRDFEARVLAGWAPEGASCCADMGVSVRPHEDVCVTPLVMQGGVTASPSDQGATTVSPSAKDVGSRPDCRVLEKTLLSGEVR